MFSFFLLLEELGLFSLEKALGDLNAAFQYLPIQGGPSGKLKRDFLWGHVVSDRTRDNDVKLE